MKTKTKTERVKERWEIAKLKMAETPGFRRFFSGDFEQKHYAWALKQLYPQVRENAGLQGLVVHKFTGDQRKIAKMFLNHAASESGHEDLIKDDLVAMNVDISDLETRKPTPALAAMMAFPFYAIHNMSPLVYLGFIFHLEFLPTTSGSFLMEKFAEKGISKSAMSFVDEHAKVDISHNKLMERYLDTCIQSEEDFELVCYGAETAAMLYGATISEAFELADADTKGKIFAKVEKIA